MTSPYDAIANLSRQYRPYFSETLVGPGPDHERMANTPGQDLLDAASKARALELGLIVAPPVVVTPPAPPTPPPAPVSVLALTVAGAQVGNSVATSLTLSTPTPLTVELAVSVRAAVANPPDTGDLDFPHVVGATLAGTQTFTSARTFATAGTYNAQVSYLGPSGTWVHLTPVVPFTIAAAPVVTPPVVTPPVVTPPVVVTPAAGNPLGSTGAQSGLAFNEGMWPYRNSGSAAAYTTAQQYQESRQGRKVDFTMGAQYYASWGDLEGLQILSFLLDYAAPVPILMLPPFPSSGGSWGDWASGANNAHGVTQGKNIAAMIGSRKVVIRAAWECNGNWYPWSIVNIGGTPANMQTVFKAGFHNWIASIRSGMGAKANQLVVSYSLAGIQDKGAGSPLTACAPADSDWDVLGFDDYDWQAATTSATTPAHASDMQTAYDFAVAHGKWMSFDEWGLHHTGASAEGGDNPNYITAMLAWIKSHPKVAYANYFQDDAATNVNSGLFSPNVNNNPKSTAAYLANVAK